MHGYVPYFFARPSIELTSEEILSFKEFLNSFIKRDLHKFSQPKVILDFLRFNDPILNVEAVKTSDIGNIYDVFLTEDIKKRNPMILKISCALTRLNKKQKNLK